MELKVDVAGKQINDALAKAILDSVIGNKLVEEVKTQVDRIVNGYHSTLATTVNQEITNHVRELLRTEYMAQIKIAVRENFLKEETINAAVEKVISKMVKEDY